MKKDKDFSTGILYEDSFEDRPLDDTGESSEHSTGILKKFLSMKRWKKIVLCVVTALVVVVAGLAGSFFCLRAQGEKNLKTEVVKTGKAKGEREGLFVTYNDKEYQYNEDIINFLCLGIDKDVSMEEMQTDGNEGLADAVVLISVNVENGQIKILAIPRDTMVPVKVVDETGHFVKNANQQITLQYVYGSNAAMSCELMVDAVSNLLYKVPIQRYCSINLSAVTVLNDTIGGVDVQVLEDVHISGKNYHAGDVLHLQGTMALDYIRDRDCDIFGSSMGRLERQKQYMSNYFSTAVDAIKADMTLPMTLFQSLQGNMCTNITTEDIAYLVPELLDVSLNMEDMSMVPGEVTQPGELEEYIVNTDQLKELVINYFYEEVPQK